MEFMMDTRSLFDHLRKFDTPTIANAVEIALGTRLRPGSRASA